MIHAALPINNHSCLRIVKDRNAYEEQLQTLSQLAWQIAYTALWNGEEFSAPEKEKAVEFIRAFIQEQSNPKKAYSAFVQRVLLARQYISTHPGTYAPVPTQWLSPVNKNGFAGTQRWYDSLEHMRLSLPLYKMQLRAFGEAVYETTASGSARDFHYWRSYFGEHSYQGLLNLFLSTIANCSH